MNETKHIFYPFLRAVRGNWRNAIFLKCGSESCPYGYTHPCEGYLLTAGDDGRLLLMPVKYFQTVTGETVYEEECLGILTRSTFEKVYSLYIEWHTASSRECSVKQLSLGMENQLCPDESL